MATATLSLTRVKPFADAWAASWTLATGDQGAPCEMVMASEKSVQVTGTFNTSTVVLQGSNDGTNWVTLTDPQGNALSFTSAALEAIEEHTRYVRPSVSGGTATALTVTLFMRGQMT